MLDQSGRHRIIEEPRQYLDRAAVDHLVQQVIDGLAVMLDLGIQRLAVQAVSVGKQHQALDGLAVVAIDLAHVLLADQGAALHRVGEDDPVGFVALFQRNVRQITLDAFNLAALLAGFDHCPVGPDRETIFVALFGLVGQNLGGDVDINPAVLHALPFQVLIDRPDLHHERRFVPVGHDVGTIGIIERNDIIDDAEDAGRLVLQHINHCLLRHGTIAQQQLGLFP